MRGRAPVSGVSSTLERQHLASTLMTATQPFDEQAAVEKWHEIAPLIDRMQKRTNTADEFAVGTGSSLFGDDAASDPYHTSHAVQMCLTAAVDHLHAVKTLILGAGVVHVAAPASLARGALETLAAAFWILHPTQRDVRVERTLRWQAKNFKDSEAATANLGLPNHVNLEDKLKKIDAVTARRGLNTTTTRKAYTSTETVVYAENHIPTERIPFGVVLPWRICSGFAHGRPWAYLGVSDRETQAGDGNIVGVRLTSSMAKSLYPSLAALHLMEELLRVQRDRSAART